MPAKKKKEKRDVTTIGLFLAIFGGIYLVQTYVPHDYLSPLILILAGALLIIKKEL